MYMRGRVESLSTHAHTHITTKCMGDSVSSSRLHVHACHSALFARRSHLVERNLHVKGVI
jgi:hypothetical protein